MRVLVSFSPVTEAGCALLVVDHDTGTLLQVGDEVIL